MGNFFTTLTWGEVVILLIPFVALIRIFVRISQLANAKSIKENPDLDATVTNKVIKGIDIKNLLWVMSIIYIFTLVFAVCYANGAVPSVLRIAALVLWIIISAGFVQQNSYSGVVDRRFKTGYKKGKEPEPAGPFFKLFKEAWLVQSCTFVLIVGHWIFT